MNEGREGKSRPIYLEVRLEDPRLVLSSFTTAKQRPIELELQPTQGFGWNSVFVVVEGGDVERLNDEFGRDPTVAEVEYLGSVGDDHRFRVLFEDGIALVPPETTEMGVRVISIRHEKGEWRIQMHVPAHSTLQRLQSHYHDNDITFRVKRLHVARESKIGIETVLPPGQKEILIIAYQSGYFNVPRNTTQEEIANRLGVSKSSVSQRIRRAVSSLIEATLSP